MKYTDAIEWILVLSITASYLLGWLIKNDTTKATIEKLRWVLIFLLILFVFGKRISDFF